MKFFISHNHADKDFVLRMQSYLQSIAQRKIELWHSDNLPIGMNWKKEIEYRIANADAYIVFLSNNYMNSPFATYELGKLLQLQKDTNKPVIPIVIQPLRITDTPVSDIMGFNISTEEELNDIAPKIIKAAEKSLSRQLPIDCGEVYLKYETLELDVLSGIMYSIKNLYSLIYSNGEYSLPKSRNVITKQDRLILYESKTGESIKFKVKTGWMPKVAADGEDVLLELPRSVIALLASFYVLSVAVENTTSSYKQIIDIVKTNNEIEIQSLQQEKMSLEIEKIRKELRNISPKAQDSIDNELQHFLRRTVHNQDIKFIRLKTHHVEVEQEY